MILCKARSCELFGLVPLRANALTTGMSKTPRFPVLVASVGAITLLTAFARPLEAAQAYEENPGTDGDGKVTVGPAYQIDPDLTDRTNSKGKEFEFSMKLAD